MALAQLRLGNVKGNTWYSGNKITGNKKEGTVFVGSEITRCFENDMYLNTDTSDIYKCTLGGNSDAAKWAYVMSVRSYGNMLSETLNAGDTQLTISNESIKENSILSFYTSLNTVLPKKIEVSNGSVTLTFDEQETEIRVAVRIEGEW